jgi:hypothetical protein
LIKIFAKNTKWPTPIFFQLQMNVEKAFSIDLDDVLKRTQSSNAALSSEANDVDNRSE